MPHFAPAGRCSAWRVTSRLKICTIHVTLRGAETTLYSRLRDIQYGRNLYEFSTEWVNWSPRLSQMSKTDFTKAATQEITTSYKLTKKLPQLPGFTCNCEYQPLATNARVRFASRNKTVGCARNFVLVSEVSYTESEASSPTWQLSRSDSNRETRKCTLHATTAWTRA